MSAGIGHVLVEGHDRGACPVCLADDLEAIRRLGESGGIARAARVARVGYDSHELLRSIFADVAAAVPVVPGYDHPAIGAEPELDELDDGEDSLPFDWWVFPRR